MLSTRSAQRPRAAPPAKSYALNAAMRPGRHPYIRHAPHHGAKPGPLYAPTLAAMNVPAHDWRDCEPVILKVPGLRAGGGEASNAETVARTTDPPEYDNMLAEAMTAAWRRLPDKDRQGWHRFCCLNSRDPDDVASVARFTAAMRYLMPERGEAPEPAFSLESEKTSPGRWTERFRRWWPGS